MGWSQDSKKLSIEELSIYKVMHGQLSTVLMDEDIEVRKWKTLKFRFFALEPFLFFTYYQLNTSSK